MGYRESGIGNREWRGGGLAVAIVRTTPTVMACGRRNPWLTARQITARTTGIRNKELNAADGAGLLWAGAAVDKHLALQCLWYTAVRVGVWLERV